MKAKKALAVLLVAVMLLATLSFGASAANEDIVSDPIKTVYTDCEYFNPQGLVITVNGKEITYSPTDKNFMFSPGLNEKLTTADMIVDDNGNAKLDENGYEQYTADVAVYYDNVKIGTITVTVSHVWGETTYMDNNYHGKYCLGCGIVDKHKFSAHNVPEYIPNDDGGVFIQQTETGTCTDCHGEITRNIPNTEKFDSLFTGNFTGLEAEFLKYIKMILVTLIQTLVGIK